MHVSRAAAMLLALVALGSGCATYRDQLGRGQRAFEQNEHDRTLSILRDLEPDLLRLSTPEQAEYAYLRGMTDYRIGYKSDARHWLALAKAYEENSPGVLPPDWKARVNESLDELNTVVYSDGVNALSTGRGSDSDEFRKDGPEPKSVKKNGRERKKARPSESP